MAVRVRGVADAAAAVEGGAAAVGDSPTAIAGLPEGQGTDRPRAASDRPPIAPSGRVPPFGYNVPHDRIAWRLHVPRRARNPPADRPDHDGRADHRPARPQ